MKIKYKLLLITVGLILLPMAISTVVTYWVVQRQNDTEAWERIDSALQMVLDNIELRGNTLTKRMRTFWQGKIMSEELRFVVSNQQKFYMFPLLKKAGNRLTGEMQKFASSAEIDRVVLYYPDGRLMSVYSIESGDKVFVLHVSDDQGRSIRLMKECRSRQICQPIPWKEEQLPDWPTAKGLKFDESPRVIYAGKALTLQIAANVNFRTASGIKGPTLARIAIHKKFDISFALDFSDLTGTDIAFFTAREAGFSPMWNAQELAGEFLERLQPDKIQHEILRLDSPYYAGFQPFVDDSGALLGVISARLSMEGAIAKSREALAYLIGIAVLSIILMIPIALYLSHRFVGPIYGLIHGAQAFGKGELEYRIPEEGKDEISDLALAFNNMAESIAQANKELGHLNQQLEEHNRDLEQKIAQAVSAIQELMDNTGQGVFAFGKEYEVYRYYSRPCHSFFGGPLDGLDGMDLMFGKPSLTADELRTWADSGGADDFEPSIFEKELIDLVFSGESTFSFLKDLLPQEFTKGERTFSVEYILISSSYGRDDKVLIILTDITKERELADKVALEEERNVVLIRVALNREGFIRFLRELEGQFLGIYAEIAKPDADINVDELLRHYHTIKGEMATYGMVRVAEQMHNIESVLVEWRDGADSEESSNILEIINATQDAQLTFGGYLDDLRTLISAEDRTRSEEVFQVPASKITRLKDFVIRQIPKEALAQVQSAIEDLSKQPIEPMLQKLASTASTLADRTNKAVRVEISGGETEVLYSRLEGFFSVMGHLVRNCVDHGLDTPETRKQFAKREVGTITIEAGHEDHSLKFKISDDGRGIDPETIKASALKKKLIDSRRAEKMTNQQLVNLIFEPGFSTSEEVSDISGRGVGMDAVKGEVELLDGDIQIHTEKNRGTAFEITIPGVT